MGRKFVATPKNLMSVTEKSKEPASLEQLAEVEQNILNALEEMAEKVFSKGKDDNKDEKKNS
ncbi:hypothetical protein [Algoriphagus sp. Y33]|uniref:hypothetical protein n=1 Tax=Algoriphagus sp. Y33 TaxID=2772483 RepID=UPI001784DBD9|nr:hypothetical protein [Algoriphagus sp. Y33]